MCCALSRWYQIIKVEQFQSMKQKMCWIGICRHERTFQGLSYGVGLGRVPGSIIQLFWIIGIIIDQFGKNGDF